MLKHLPHGVLDYLKYDNCLANGRQCMKDYERMRDALASCGRDIVYSIWHGNFNHGCQIQEIYGVPQLIYSIYGKNK
jgi:hypothetical protein